jgi:hypothetical protein
MGIGKNTLLRMKAVIDEYKRHEHPGVSSAFIYREYIYPKFYISPSRFYDYLATPVDKLLKEFCNEEN